MGRNAGPSRLDSSKWQRVVVNEQCKAEIQCGILGPSIPARGLAAIRINTPRGPPRFLPDETYNVA